jgi:hypothetical protein
MEFSVISYRKILLMLLIALLTESAYARVILCIWVLLEALHVTASLWKIIPMTTNNKTELWGH